MAIERCAQCGFDGGTWSDAAAMEAIAPEPRSIDVPVTLSGIEHEVRELYGRLTDVSSASWEAVVVIGGEDVDLHWIARHAVHDASHHLDDVQRLRMRL
jgi:hypothetical protein